MESVNPQSMEGRKREESAAGQARGVLERGGEAYGEAKEAVGDLYERTAQAWSDTYNQAITYGRNHPGQVSLIAFGAGIGVGLLLANAFPRRSRAADYAEPLVNTLSQIATDFLRRR